MSGGGQHEEPGKAKGAASPRMQRVQQLFVAALELPPAQRAAFLDRECRGDDALRHELNERLAAERPSLMEFLKRSSHQPMPGLGDRIGQYELIRSLGRRGMGMVYLARDVRLGRRVAIKFLAMHGRNTSEDVLAEARAVARCNHENIVVIYDVGEHGGLLYMVLEYVEGLTLRNWLDDYARVNGPDGGDTVRTPLPPARAAELMIPVVRALACAHDMGIVHRSLNPSNIMVTRAGTIKVFDFGIAKLMERARGGAQDWDSIDDSGWFLETTPYMSPAQLAGEDVDHRADIWAAGIMLFEMVTGTHPTLQAESSASFAFQQFVSETTRLDVPMPGVHERWPDLGPLAGIIDRCLIKDQFHRTGSARILLQELESLVGGRRRLMRGEHDSPFPGLAPFQEADADRFFGRARDIAGLVARLREQPLVTVAGPSGAGKSSVVRAGVIPTLKSSGERWQSLVIRPGRQPLTALAEMLALRSSVQPQALTERDVIMARLRTEPGYLGIALRTWARAKQRRLVLFVDQFEELYTLGASNEERTCVIACLGSVADDLTSPLRVILSVRSDFLDRLAEHRAFFDIVSQGLIFLPPLGRDNLREALLRPVEVCDYRFQSPAMVERILDELAATRNPLPLLQFTAEKLWVKRNRQQRIITESSLHALGDLNRALANHADEVLASMPRQDARLARAVFLRLVTPERTRALPTLAELRQLDSDTESIHRVLTQLADTRLLRVEHNSGSAANGDELDAVVEVVHESLIDTWPLLGQWLIESEEDVLFLQRLRRAARDWQQSGRDSKLLWSGQAAREARAWHERYQGAIASVEEQYLAEVLAAADRTAAARSRPHGPFRWLRWPRWLRLSGAAQPTTPASWSMHVGPALLPEHHPRQCIQIVLDGDVGQLNEETRARIIKEAREKTGDVAITIRSIKRGSILLELDVSVEAAAMLRKLFESGDLKSLGGIPIRAIKYDHETSPSPAVVSCSDNAEAALAEFFVTAFTADELRQMIRSLSDGARLDAALPGTPAPLSILASAAAHAIVRHNLVGNALFGQLEYERPHRRDDIHRIRQLFIGTAGSASRQHDQ